MSFGKRLRELRLEQNVLLKDMADRLGITQASLGKYERDERKPDFDTIVKICDCFNVSSDYLFGRTANKNTTHYMLDNLVSNFQNLPFDQQHQLSLLIADLHMVFTANASFYHDQTTEEFCQVYKELFSTYVFTLSKLNDLNSNMSADIFNSYNKNKISLIESLDNWFDKCYRITKPTKEKINTGNKKEGQ